MLGRVRRNIVITGASSGLGAEMARQFVTLGRNVGICARRTDRLTRLAEELRAIAPRSKVVAQPLDVDDHTAVFKTFQQFDEELDGVDRVIVNAGLGQGYPIGTGKFEINRATAETNFVSALAQCEAAMEIFRGRRAGHLVVVASMNALRGARRHGTTYAASKAALANLAEGIRADVHSTPIKVTTLLPGFIRSEMTANAGRTPFIVDTQVGVRAMIAAMEREKATAKVPRWPWLPVSWVMRIVPVSVLSKV
jgi:short-subunit dehydrogenase